MSGGWPVIMRGPSEPKSAMLQKAKPSIPVPAWAWTLDLGLATPDATFLAADIGAPDSDPSSLGRRLRYTSRTDTVTEPSTFSGRTPKPGAAMGRSHRHRRDETATRAACEVASLGPVGLFQASLSPTVPPAMVEKMPNVDTRWAELRHSMPPQMPSLARRRKGRKRRNFLPLFTPHFPLHLPTKDGLPWGRIRWARPKITAPTKSLNRTYTPLHVPYSGSVRLMRQVAEKFLCVSSPHRRRFPSWGNLHQAPPHSEHLMRQIPHYEVLNTWRWAV
ncbi:hypothetical protein VTK26DRAFT_8947 [Humicola hyalothermophila]